jgi:hypothetical protein
MPVPPPAHGRPRSPALTRRALYPRVAPLPPAGEVRPGQADLRQVRPQLQTWPSSRGAALLTRQARRPPVSPPPAPRRCRRLHLTCTPQKLAPGRPAGQADMRRGGGDPYGSHLAPQFSASALLAASRADSDDYEPLMLQVGHLGARWVASLSAGGVHPHARLGGPNLRGGFILTLITYVIPGPSSSNRHASHRTHAPSGGSAAPEPPVKSG